MFVVAAFIPTALYASGFTWLATSWLPIALLGTAVAFITGFKNNTSYARLWKARQIGAASRITAMSRTIEIDLRDMLGETPLPAPFVADRNILM